MGYLISETYQEKEANLRNAISVLKHTKNSYYIHRFNPLMFLATLPFTRVLAYALDTLGYPKLVMD